jgi:hypothetical protein
MNPQIRETLEWLKQQGLPPLPIASAQDPERFPARNQDGSLKVGQNGALIPAFTGKNPSFLDSRGVPHLIRHTRYQDRLPSAHELDLWFSHPANGIGTLGGWRGLVWIDVDVKQFESQAACDSRIAQWLNHYPLLRQTFTERTHSGGWRFAVRVHEKTFTNFSLDGAGGRHMGEALGQGRFTVLAPTIGPSGNAYVNLNRAPPVWVERLDGIGLYPVSRRREQAALSHVRRRSHPQPTQPGVLRLEDLATAKAQSILYGESPLESRSHSLTYALREFYGWENWAAQNRVPMSGDAEELARAAGAALGIGAERVERIMESIADPASCAPAAVFAGGETSAWKRVWKLDRGVYQELCPDSIQQSIQANARENHHVLTARKPQKRQNAVIQASVIHNSAISVAQIQTFVRQAQEILAHVHQLRQGELTGGDSAVVPKFWVQGQVYRIAAEGRQLIVQARGRGIILQAQGDTVTSECLTMADLNRFQAEVSRIQNSHRLIRATKATSSPFPER